MPDIQLPLKKRIGGTGFQPLKVNFLIQNGPKKDYLHPAPTLI